MMGCGLLFYIILRMLMAESALPSEQAIHSTFDDLKMRVGMCDLFFKQQCSRNYYIEELSLIRSQMELMEQIKENLSSKGLATSMCKQDRETTRDIDNTQLSQSHSIGAMLTVTSPTNSCISSRTSFFRRGSAIQPSSLSQLVLEVEAKCTVQSRQLLGRLIDEGKRMKDLERENKRLKADIAKASKEIDQIKIREIAAEAKLYDVNKKLQNYEAVAADTRSRREDYASKLTQLQHKQISLNKFEISLMVRQKAARTQSTSFSEWIYSIQKYRSDLLTLKNSIEQVISNPDTYTYRKLADTVIRSLDCQEASLDEQSEILNRLENKLQTVFKSLRKPTQ